MRSSLIIISFAVACGGRSPVAPFDPSLATSTQVLRFTARVNEVVAPQYISVVDAHGLNLDWRATNPASWVHLSPSHGLTPSEVRVTVSTRGLAPGSHRAGIALSMEGDGENAAGTSFIVDLTLDAPGWTALGGPLGASATAIAVNPDDPNIIVAGTNDGDLLISADGGVSFNHVDINNSEAFAAVLFADGNRAYAGAEGVYRSDDGGVTWSLAGLANRTVFWLAVDPTNSDRLLVEGDGLWRSVDSGVNWEQVATPDGSHCLTGDPTRPGTFVFGASGSNVYTTSAIAGAVATPVSNTGYDVDHYVASIAVLPAGRWVAAHDVDSGHTPALRVSDDAGVTWSNPGGAGLPDEEESVVFWLTVVGDELIGLHKGLFRSRDGGATFEPLPIDIPDYRGDGRRWYGAAGHPGGLLLAHRALGVIRYHVDGSQQLPLTDFRVAGVEVDATSGDIFGILRPGGVFARVAGTFVGIGEGMHAERPNDISLDPRSPASIAVSGEDSEVAFTTDGGTTWTTGGIGLALEDGRRISRAPDDPDVLWVTGYSSGLFRTADNGASWTEVSGASTSHVAAISATEALFFAGGEIRHTTASGTVTVVLDPDDDMTMLRRTGDGSHWFGGWEGLQRSTDNGQTFTNLGLGEGHFNDIVTVPGEPTHVFLATDSALLESLDRGATWENVDAPFTPSSLAYDPNTGAIIVGTVLGGVYTYSP